MSITLSAAQSETTAAPAFRPQKLTLELNRRESGDGDGGRRNPFERRGGSGQEPDGGGPANPNGGADPQPAVQLPKTIILLIALMALVQFIRGALPPELDRELMFRGALLLTYQGNFLWDRLYTLITSAFLHDGWLHFGFNAFWLATIGTLVQRVLGDVRFLLLFFAAVIAGGLAQTVIAWESPVFLIGASGGVFGKLTVFPAIMMALNLAYAYIGGGLPTGEPMAISWAAHGGGLLAGVLLFPLLWKRPQIAPFRRPGA